MNRFVTEYLEIGPEHLGKGQPVKLRILKDMAAIADDMARPCSGASARPARRVAIRPSLFRWAR